MAQDHESRPLLDPASPGQSPVTEASEDSGASSHEQGRLQASSLAGTGISRRLYISHFLSMSNSRIFEFGSVLYLASIFPGTLLPLSVYAVGRGLAAIALSSALGYYIDVGNRLQVVRLSIVLQRVAVAASCVILFSLKYGWLSPRSGTVMVTSLVAVTALACVEKLASIMNTVSVERDWVSIASNKQ